MAKTRNVTKQSLEDEVQSALKWLKSHSTKSTLEGMARYAIPSDKAFGVAYKDMKVLGRLLGEIMNSPPPSGTPACTRRAWWPRSSLIRHR